MTVRDRVDDTPGGSFGGFPHKPAGKRASRLNHEQPCGP